MQAKELGPQVMILTQVPVFISGQCLDAVVSAQSRASIAAAWEAAPAERHHPFFSIYSVN